MVSDSTVQREGESVSSGGNLLSNTEPVSESEMKTESESTMKESLSQITDGVSGSSSVWAENSSGGNAGEETAESLTATEEALAGSDAFWEDSEESSADTSAEVSARRSQAAYVIKPGDTLADICTRYYGSLDRMEEICRENEITDANMILPGQEIILP